MQQRSVPNVTRVRLRAWKWSDLCSSVVFGARRRFWSGLGSPRQFITRNLLWFNVAPDKIKCNFLHHGTCKVYTPSRERLIWIPSYILREAFKNYLADFVRNGQSFCQKTLSGKGGYPPPPLNGKSAKLFRKFVFLKGLKMMFLYWIRLKMDQRGHIID